MRSSLLSTLVFILAHQLVFALNPACGFQYKKTITIQGSRVAGGPHTDFPVLISHTDSDLRTIGNGGNVSNANGFDILFADNNGDLLEFQLERYVATTGQIVAWVKLPSITNGTDVVIHLLYGKPTITTDQSTTSVWSSGYHAVWHLNNNSFADGTANAHNGTNNGSTNVAAARIAGGRNFVDPNQWIELSTFPDMTTSFTISGWIRTVDNTEAGQRVFCDDRFNSNGGYAMSLGDGGTGVLRFYLRGLSNVILDSPGNTILNNTWYHCVAVLDRSTNVKRLYVNGIQVATQTATGTLGTDAGNASIGGEVAAGEAANRFDGDLDEIRSYNGVLSANWILTEFRSQNLPTSFPGSNVNDFYTVGAEEDIFHTSTGNGDWDQTGIWDSGEVPNGIFENVVITRDVDIDAGSGNYTICNCSLQATGAQNVFLDINSTRTLTIEGDLEATFSGAGASNLRIRVEDDAIVNVGGSVVVNRTNSSITADVVFQVIDNAVLNVDTNMSFSQSAGDNFTIDFLNNAAVTVLGNMEFGLSGGNVLRMDIDDNAVVNCSGDVLVTHSGGNDIDFYINNTSGIAGVWNVGGDFIMNHTGGDDIEIFIDDANSELNITGAFSGTFTGATDGERLNFNMDAGVFTAGAIILSRGTNFGQLYFDIDGGTFTCASLDITSSGTLFTGGEVRLEIDQNTVFAVTGDVDVDMTGGDDFSILVNGNAGNSAQVLVGGNFTINRTNGDDIILLVDDDNSIFQIDGNFTLTTTGGEQFDIDLDNNATFDVGGNFSITHSQGQLGEINLEHDNNNSNPTFNVNGNFSLTLSGGADVYTINHLGGNFTVGGNMTVLQSSAGATEDVFIFLENDAVMSISGGLTLTLAGGDDISFHLGTNSVGSIAQLTVGTNFLVDHNGATGGDDLTVILDDDTRINVTGNLVIDSDFSGDDLLFVRLNNTAELDVNGNVQFTATVQGKSELELNNTSILRLAGNFIRSAAPNDFGILDCNNTSRIVFDGTAAQIFPQDDGGGTDAFELQFVTINNTFGTSPQLTMEGLATVNGGITFTDGVISSTATNILVIANNASTAGASDASHVMGFVRKIGNAPAAAYLGNGYAFPVGDNGAYRPIFISAPANTTDYFEARYFNENPDALYDIEALEGPLFRVSSVEYWQLDRSGASNVSVRLSWNANSVVTNLATLRLARWNGTDWESLGNSGTTGTTTDGTVISDAAVTNFSPFTLGTVGNTNPLPIELLSFEGKIQGPVNVLDWFTATEVNNDYFTLERAGEDHLFNRIATISGAGNSNTPKHYNYIDDAPMPGLNYYSLSQTDFNGAVTFFETIVLNRHDLGSSMKIWPIPASSTLNISSDTPLEKPIILYNAIGQISLEIAPDRSTNITLDITRLSPGLYFLEIDNSRVKVLVQP